MRYTINGFQQDKLLELGLDNNDSLILRWFVDFYHTGKMAIVSDDGKNYLWVSYQSVINDLPILGINSKDVIARKFKKMVECGLMEHFTKKEGGTFSCYKLVENNYLALISSDKNYIVTKKSEPSDSKVGTPSDSKVGTKDYSIKVNDSINNPTNTPNSKNSEFGHDNDKIETDLYKPLIPNDHYTKIDEESFKNIPTPEITTFEELAKETELFNMSNNLDNFADKITNKKGIKSDTDINNQINSDNIPNSCKKIKEPDSLDELIKFWNDEMRENIIISKKNRGSIYGIIKVQSLDRLKKAITQAKKQIETKKGIRYTFGSIIYKDSNISNLCAQYDKDDPYKDLPESTRKKLEEMRRKK